MRCSALVFNRVRSSSSLRPSPPTSVCLDILLLPGASVVATQVERLSSNETNKVAQSPRLQVRSGAGRVVACCIGRFLGSVMATSTYQSLAAHCIGSVCGRSVWILTMMQSCASAAKLPILSVGIECPVSTRFPPPRIVDRQSPLWMPAASVEQGKEMISRGSLACRTQGDAVQWLANGDKSPERDEQLARQGDDHCFARGATAIGRAGLVPLGQCAVLLKPQKAPGELDHPTWAFSPRA